MKKISFILTVVFSGLFFLPGHSQPKAGFKAGMNVASLSSFEGSYRLGIHAGFFASIKLDKQWRFQPEILYSAEGQHYSFEGKNRTLALGYAQLPLMIRYLPAEKFYLEFGPQPGFLIQASSSGEDINKLNVKRSFSNNQFALNAGAGVQINKRMSFYGRYHFGLTDVTSGDIVDHSRVILVGLSMQFK